MVRNWAHIRRQWNAGQTTSALCVSLRLTERLEDRTLLSASHEVVSLTFAQASADSIDPNSFPLNGSLSGEDRGQITEFLLAIAQSMESPAELAGQQIPYAFADGRLVLVSLSPVADAGLSHFEVVVSEWEPKELELEGDSEIVPEPGVTDEFRNGMATGFPDEVDAGSQDFAHSVTSNDSPSGLAAQGRGEPGELEDLEDARVDSNVRVANQFLPVASAELDGLDDHSRVQESAQASPEEEFVLCGVEPLRSVSDVQVPDSWDSSDAFAGDETPSFINVSLRTWAPADAEVGISRSAASVPVAANMSASVEMLLATIDPSELSGMLASPLEPLVGLASSVMLVVETLGETVLFAIGSAGKGSSPVAEFVEPLVELAELTKPRELWEIKTVDQVSVTPVAQAVPGRRQFDLRNIGEPAAIDFDVTEFITLLTLPRRGTLEQIGAQPTVFRYLPDPGFSGVDGFRFRLKTADGGSRESEVVIHVSSGDRDTATIRMANRVESATGLAEAQSTVFAAFDGWLVDLE